MMDDQPNPDADVHDMIRISGGRTLTDDLQPLTMDEQLDMLERLWDVENGEAHVETWRDGSEYPWHITCVNHGDEWGDDDPQGPTVREERRTTYSGDTLADAIAHAWRRHRGPTPCAACDGMGYGLREGQPGERVPVRPNESEHITHDDRQMLRWDCEACFEQTGYVLTLPDPSEVRS